LIFDCFIFFLVRELMMLFGVFVFLGMLNLIL
jgi:hypothetical protein